MNENFCQQQNTEKNGRIFERDKLCILEFVAIKGIHVYVEHEYTLTHTNAQKYISELS